MPLPINRLRCRLPRRFPVGATYVVEGYGGERGDLRVVSRYVVLPGGGRINVPGDLIRLASARVPGIRPNRDRNKSPANGRSERPHKKFTPRTGTQ